MLFRAVLHIGEICSLNIKIILKRITTYVKFSYERTYRRLRHPRYLG